MSGEFFDPVKPDEHVCSLPKAEFAPKDNWRCECGWAWVRIELHQHGEYWWQWKRDPQFDKEK